MAEMTDKSRVEKCFFLEIIDAGGGHNSPIFDEYQTQSAEVWALP